MKTLIAAALMIVSVSTFANERSSVDSFLSVLPVGLYAGKDDQGVGCSISVNEVNFPEKAILITAEKSKSKVTKMVKEGSEFIFKAFKQEFIQTDRYFVDDSRIAYYDKIVRTINAGDKLLYVVVAVDTYISGTRASDKVECVVDVK